MRRFPWVATIATLIAFAILIALGVWQLKRLAWKEHLLAQVAALQHAPAQPLNPVLERALRGQDVEFTRVGVDCVPPDPPQGRVSLYATRESGPGWRALAPCRIDGAPWPMIVIDRGFEPANGPLVRPSQAAFPAPRHVIGVMRRIAAATFIQQAARSSEGEANGYQVRSDAVTALAKASGLQAAPVVVVAEREDPTPQRLEPAALPGEIPNNHFQYALTWFGLALALLGVYAGMLFTRLRRPPESPE
jgi:surfeit locus 1 family protein